MTSSATAPPYSAGQSDSRYRLSLGRHPGTRITRLTCKLHAPISIDTAGHELSNRSVSCADSGRRNTLPRPRFIRWQVRGVCRMWLKREMSRTGMDDGDGARRVMQHGLADRAEQQPPYRAQSPGADH